MKIIYSKQNHQIKVNCQIKFSQNKLRFLLYIKMWSRRTSKTFSYSFDDQSGQCAMLNQMCTGLRSKEFNFWWPNLLDIWRWRWTLVWYVNRTPLAWSSTSLRTPSAGTWSGASYARTLTGSEESKANWCRCRIIFWCFGCRAVDYLWLQVCIIWFFNCRFLLQLVNNLKVCYFFAWIVCLFGFMLHVVLNFLTSFGSSMCAWFFCFSCSYGGGSFSFSRLILGITESFNTDVELQQVLICTDWSKCLSGR